MQLTYSYVKIFIIESIEWDLKTIQGENMDTEKRQIKIRDTLLRNIANKNRKITSIFGKVFASDSRGYSDAFSSLLSSFVGNNRLLNEVTDVEEKHSQNRLSAYNYFDMNTLYAYNRFLEVVLEELKQVQGVTERDIFRAVDNAGKYMRTNADKSKSNFYNLSEPVKLMYKATSGDKVVSPRRTMSETQFIRTYGVNSIDAMQDVWEYFSEKRTSLKNQRREEINRDIERESEYINYLYKGKKIRLMIEHKQYFIDENGGGVVSIRAMGKDGTLFTTRTPSGKVYNGLLYDNNGRMVDEESGEIFYPKSNINDFSPNEYTDDDQMTLF